MIQLIKTSATADGKGSQRKSANNSEGRTTARRIVGAAVAVLTLALLVTACDPAYTEDIVIRNASSHYVHITHYGINDNDSSIASNLHNYFYLAPNEEVVVEQLGGLGSASLEMGVNYLKVFYGDSVKLGFGGFSEDGLLRERTYYAWETTGSSPYNFQSLNYTYEEKRNTGLVFHDMPYYGKLTFTITDEHYNAAE